MKYFLSFITGVFIVLLPNLLISQPGFNKLVEVGFDKNHFRDMIVVNDTIIGYGIGFDNPDNGNQGMILVKLDSTGELLKSKLILDSLGHPMAIAKHWGNIIPTEDGGFAMTAAVVGRRSAFLIKTNRDFEVEFIKEYNDTMNLSNFRYNVVEIESGYLLFGSIEALNSLERPFIRKVDFMGEIIWNQFYGNGSLNGIITDIEVIDDTSVVSISLEHASSNLFGPVNSVFRKIHIEDGSVFFQKTSAPDPALGQVLNITPIVGSDVGFITLGVAIIDQIGNTKIVKTAITRLDNSFNVVWTKMFGREGTLSAQRWFRNLGRTSDGEGIAAGESHNRIGGDEIPSGWLMKFSIDGDSIWSRYDVPDFPVDSLGDTYFGGVGVLSSGNIIAGGTATLWNDKSPWLIKVTTDGCMEVIDCGLVPVSERGKEKGGEMLVYPNPANGKLNVVLEDVPVSPWTLAFYNVQGQLVHQKEITQLGLETEVSTHHLNDGFYIIKAMSSGLTLQSGKVFIQH